MTQFKVEAATRNLLGEGPVWVAREAALYWVDITGRGLHRHEPASGTTTSVGFDEPISCVAPRAGGGFIATLASGFCELDGAGAFVRFRARPELDLHDNRFNDGGVDPAGRFYCGTMNTVSKKPTGSLYRLERDGTATQVVAGVSTSNSLAFSPSGDTLYFCDTNERTIRAYDYHLEAGALGPRRTFVGADAAPGKPDGSAVDADGYLWNARWKGWGIARFAPDGTLEHFVDLPVECCTCCAFGGPDLRTLFVTSASAPLSDPEKEAQPHAGALLSIEVGTPGVIKPEADY